MFLRNQSKDEAKTATGQLITAVGHEELRAVHGRPCHGLGLSITCHHLRPAKDTVSYVGLLRQSRLENGLPSSLR